MSPEYLRTAERVARDQPTQRLIYPVKSTAEDGPWVVGIAKVPSNTPTQKRTSNICQSQRAQRQLMRVSVQIRPLSLNTSFFLYFTRKYPKMVSKPGRVEIEYREIERKPSVSPCFYCKFLAWSILETQLWLLTWEDTSNFWVKTMLFI